MKALALALMGTLLPVVAGAETLAYIGTETSGSKPGIYVASVDEATGAFERTRLAAAIANPGFLALHPAKHRLYAGDGKLPPMAAGPKPWRPLPCWRTGALNSSTQPAGGNGPATWPWTPADACCCWPTTTAATSWPTPPRAGRPHRPGQLNDAARRRQR